MMTVLFGAFSVLLFSGMPVGFSMALSAIAAVFMQGQMPLNVVTQRMFVQVDSFPLMAVPFFILAGELMERGGMSHRLVRFASSLVGHVRGGLMMASILGAMIFAGVSGSATADASAIGSVAIPAMLKKGYRPGLVASLIASAGAIGPVIPPSILMIIYGSIAGVSIGAMFLGGFIPGVLVGLSLMIISYWYARRLGYAGEPRASLREIGAACAHAAWALVMPGIVLGGIFGGVFTATEAGVVAVIYAIIVGIFIHRELRWRDLEPALVNAGVTSALVMIIIAGAAPFGFILGREQFPTMAVQFLTDLSRNPAVIMFLVLVFMLIVGCFIEILAAAIILIPVLGPVAAQYGFDHVHFAVVIVVSMVIGGVTPPVGVLLYLTTSMAKTTLIESCRYVWPYVLAMIVVLFLIAYVPDLVMVLPRMVYGK